MPENGKTCKSCSKTRSAKPPSCSYMWCKAASLSTAIISLSRNKWAGRGETHVCENETHFLHCASDRTAHMVLIMCLKWKPIISGCRTAMRPAGAQQVGAAQDQQLKTPAIWRAIGWEMRRRGLVAFLAQAEHLDRTEKGCLTQTHCDWPVGKVLVKGSRLPSMVPTPLCTQ